jgi:citrate lyase beta subunit
VQTHLLPPDLSPVMQKLSVANREFTQRYPGILSRRQPVHTLYGGAHLYKNGASGKLGNLALRHFEIYASNSVEMATALGIETLDDSGEQKEILSRVFDRVIAKLQREPIEDQRIDFEDGYGLRSDEEEDSHAVSAAVAVHAGMQSEDLPPFIGIRVKALTEEGRERSIRTLDIFLSTLTALTDGKLPDPFYVTLPKVTHPVQVEVLASCLDTLEERCGLESGQIQIELMIETIQSIFKPTGECGIPDLVSAGSGRVSSAILGTFDYTASCNIASNHQDHQHPSADFARQMMQVSLTGTGVTICDGITNIIPVPLHRGDGLTEVQLIENTTAIHDAWRIHFDNIMYSLELGFYQSWDLNPAQLPIRYMAVYYFFLEGLADASARLKTFIDQATKASMVGNTFDDAASAEGLLNFFVSGLSCGALTEDEALQSGATLEEIRERSFLKIVENRLGGTNNE